MLITGRRSWWPNPRIQTLVYLCILGSTSIMSPCIQCTWVYVLNRPYLLIELEVSFWGWCVHTGVRRARSNFEAVAAGATKLATPHVSHWSDTEWFLHSASGIYWLWETSIQYYIYLASIRYGRSCSSVQTHRCTKFSILKTWWWWYLP
jgi:hypothetical protein